MIETMAEIILMSALIYALLKAFSSVRQDIYG